MLGRSPIRVSHVLAVTALTAGFVCAGFVVHPSAALAASAAAQSGATVRHAVTFESNGAFANALTGAQTVGDFLHERNIAVRPNDFVYPSTDVPLSDGLVVTYRPAVPVTIRTARTKLAITSSAPDVGALLEENHVTLGKNDVVKPDLSDPVPANGEVRIVRVVTWDRTVHHALAMDTVRKLDFTMGQGKTRVVTAGHNGDRVDTIRYTQRDGGPVQRTVLASRVVRKPQTRVVVQGVSEYEAFEHFETQGVARTLVIAQSAMQMVATAYTAGCYGCSGITATGRPAGHGIVAVDPRVIPLGTRLFIPGYGIAVAGDTGGAIRGNRIDLGFNSLRDALLFGRREITVYLVK